MDQRSILVEIQALSEAIKVIKERSRVLKLEQNALEVMIERLEKQLPMKKSA